MSAYNYHPSEHKDDCVAFWIVAYVHQLDTHVRWSAKGFTRHDSKEGEHSTWLFQNYFSDACILHELIKRGVVSKVYKDDEEAICDQQWGELQETLRACKPFISIPLTDDAEKRMVQYRDPSPMLWLEIVIYSFTEEVVRFTFSLWGYKYRSQEIVLDKQAYYLFADRTEAKIRFVNDWFPLEAVSQKLRTMLARNNVLAPISGETLHEVFLLQHPTDHQILSSCRSLHPLLERVMRVYAANCKWQGKTATLGDLIGLFSQRRVLSEETIVLLQFVAKPNRDYLQHGREMPISMAKILLVTIFDLMLRLADELEER